MFCRASPASLSQRRAHRAVMADQIAPVSALTVVAIAAVAVVATVVDAVAAAAAAVDDRVAAAVDDHRAQPKRPPDNWPTQGPADAVYCFG